MRVVYATLPQVTTSAHFRTRNKSGRTGCAPMWTQESAVAASVAFILFPYFEIVCNGHRLSFRWKGHSRQRRIWP
jgi:hypothetical protein